ncbi:hypothetical protein K438DRAFT_1859290 [Mycena galopus ATCC 62051]|nr:hypothetical protein K438DRAFT_1859290 [Mycena galopus ATCC 62051]
MTRMALLWYFCSILLPLHLINNSRGNVTRSYLIYHMRRLIDPSPTLTFYINLLFLVSQTDNPGEDQITCSTVSTFILSLRSSH